jgi:hypothetical protein
MESTDHVHEKGAIRGWLGPMTDVTGVKNRARLTGHERTMLAISVQEKDRKYVSKADGVT